MKLFIITHKIISAVILIAFLGSGYLVYKKNTSTVGEVRYITALATKGTIISSVSGSGQVSALNQIDIKPSVSGNLTYVGIVPGSKVGNGQALFSIDNTSALKAVRDAETSLESEQISIDKLQIQNSDVNMNTSLVKSYDNGFNTVSNTFLDLPGIMSGLHDMFFKSTISMNGQWNVDWYEAQVTPDDTDNVKPYKQNFVDSYNLALAAFNTNSDNYKSVSRTSDGDTIDKLISQTYNDVKLISDAIKNANSYIDFVNSSITKRNNNPTPAIVTTNKATLNDYTGKTNGDLSNLLSIETDIQSNKDSFKNNDLDAQSSELSLKQKENALQDAKDNLADYTVYAPFAGTISSVPVQRHDSVGSGTTLATIITTDKIATISLNEVDIAKIQLGQKATLTFDAIPDLTITGKVIQIDSIGTVSQGVVNYSVKLSFDTNDDRVKPGMSISASIITDIKQDVLTVPNGAVKNQGGSTYVQIFDAPLAEALPGVQGSPSLILPREQTVTTGATDDTSTEIVSGLKEGDIVVTRTVSPTKASTTTAPSILGSTTNRAGAGGAVRTQGAFGR